MNNKQDYVIKKINLNNFLSPEDGKLVQSSYDEPTYLTFRVNFNTDIYERILEIVSVDEDTFDAVFKYTTTNKLEKLSYNDMPEALLCTDPNNPYSTLNYLRNYLGDNFRADLMKDFLSLLSDLNDKFPYYIKSIEGLDKLLEVSAKRGSRIKKDTAITFKCLEGLDQRISTLKTLYKKIAWDDEYQRWILPDIMRYFRMDIYISEFRIFHENKKNKDIINTLNGKLKNGSKLSSINTIKNVLNSVGDVLSIGGNMELNSFSLSDSAVNKVIPTTIITCKMCEFDIDNNYKIYSSLDRSNPKGKMVDDVELKIKVGNVEEVIYNGSFKTPLYIADKRLKHNYEGKDMNQYYKVYSNIKNDIDDLYQRRTGIERILDDDYSTTNLSDTNGGGALGYLGKAIKEAAQGALAYGDNKLNDLMNNALNKKLGNNLSINDMLSAVASGNINTMYNTFKNKAEQVDALYPEISQATTSDVALESFKSFVEEVEKNKKDIINSQIAKELLAYGDRINASSIDEYMDIISAATNEIYNDIINRNLADLPENYSSATSENDLSINIDQPKDYSTATNQDINTKIVL